jgi:hypothetical protein
MKRVLFSFLFIFIFIPISIANASWYEFNWNATVDSVKDNSNNDATLAGVSIGDLMTATVTYDTLTFGLGTSVTTDGLDYAAPSELQMSYYFDSGGVFSKDITAVRARDGGDFDQWNWRGGDFGGLLFQANDFSDASFELPLPASFDSMHDLFLNSISAFSASTGNQFEMYSGTDRLRIVSFGDQQSFSITESPIPEPNTMILFGIGMICLAGISREKK